MNSRPSRDPGPGAWYDVYRRVFPFGIREWLGRIQAPTRQAADQLATATHGADILVVLACGSKRHAQRTTAELQQQREQTRRYAGKSAHDSPDDAA